MGIGGSKKTKAHDNCNCDLYKYYQHCCKQQCFGASREATKNALLAALKQYKAEYISSTIMEYLPDKYNITKMEVTNLSSDKNYIAYTYEPINKIVQDNQPPCNIWIRSINASQAAKHKQDLDALTPEFKMVMYGSGGVGKSALTIRFITNNFLDEYDPTIEDSYRKSVGINGRAVLMDILDTAGREEFSSMQDLWIKEGKIFLCVFSITSRVSWEEVDLYRYRLIKTKKDDTDWGMILVSNKCDLEEYRKVSREEILEKAMEWNVPWVETSAKDKKNVEFAYQQGIYAYWMNSTAQCVNYD